MLNVVRLVVENVGSRSEVPSISEDEGRGGSALSRTGSGTGTATVKRWNGEL